MFKTNGNQMTFEFLYDECKFNIILEKKIFSATNVLTKNVKKVVNKNLIT